MKFRSIFFVLFSLILIGCRCTKSESESTSELSRIEVESRQNEETVQLTKSSVTGTVEVSDDGNYVYVVIDPESKSRKSYEVLGDLKAEVAEFVGEELTVCGELTVHSQWSGEIIADYWEVPGAVE